MYDIVHLILYSLTSNQYREMNCVPTVPTGLWFTQAQTIVQTVWTRVCLDSIGPERETDINMYVRRSRFGKFSAETVDQLYSIAVQHKNLLLSIADTFSVLGVH